MTPVDWMTLAEVAVAFRVTPDTVRSWIRRGLLVAELRRGDRTATGYQVRRTDARAFAERHYLGKPRPAWLDEDA